MSITKSFLNYDEARIFINNLESRMNESIIFFKENLSNYKIEQIGKFWFDLYKSSRATMYNNIVNFECSSIKKYGLTFRVSIGQIATEISISDYCFFNDPENLKRLSELVKQRFENYKISNEPEAKLLDENYEVQE